MLTGARGFIGRHVLRLLRSAGHDVVPLLRTPDGDIGPSLLDALDDPERLAAAMREHGTELVVHAAWEGHPRSAGFDHLAQLRANVFPSTNLVMAAATAGVEGIVFLSTGGGQPTARIRPAYGVAKQLVEGVLGRAGEQFGLVTTTLRPTAVYGPGQDPTAGLGAVSTFAWRILRDEPIEILGSLANGRDFLHVDDLARLVVSIVERPQSGLYEAGGPEMYRLDQLIAALEDEIGHPAAVTVVEAPDVDPTVVGLDNTAATEAFGWTPARRVGTSISEVVADLRVQLERSGAQDVR